MNAWPPKDWRALIALLGSIAGAAALTAFLVYGYALNADPAAGWTTATEKIRAYTARWVLWIVAAGIVLVLASLGMAINRRRITGTFGKASVGFEGGDDGDLPPELKVPPVEFGTGAGDRP